MIEKVTIMNRKPANKERFYEMAVLPPQTILWEIDL